GIGQACDALRFGPAAGGGDCRAQPGLRSQALGERLERRPGQSTVAPLSLATFDHLAVSASTKRVNSSTEVPTYSEPVSASTRWYSGDFMTFCASALSFSTISFGVPAGAKKPYHA